MDSKRKKELILEYQNRKPEMGVVSYRCKETGEAFLGISEDTKATINSTNTKLSSGYHPNTRLFGLWKQYGMEGFDIEVIRVLKYEDPKEDHMKELEKLREECLAADEKAKRIWK